MITVIVATPKGELINETYEYIIADGDNGQIGILTNRLPVITKITNGFIKAVNQKEEKYVAIINGVLDSKDNEVTVVAHYAAIANTLDEALQVISDNKNKIIEENKRRKVDFVQAEKELIKNIKESKAAHIDN